MPDVSPRPQHTGGRPTPEVSAQLDRQVLEVATALFVEQGYAATSLEKIARVIGCSKATLYRRYSSKEDLFKAVVAERGRLLLHEAGAMEASSKDPLVATREIARFFLDFMLRPETREAYRIVISDGHRIPFVADEMMVTIVEPFVATISRLLRVAADAGRIESHDHEEMTRVLMSLVIGWPLQNTMLGQNRMQDAAARKKFFDRAWGIFLSGICTNASA
ncbi:TetR/AcrR family transcriptional regulator [Komagataeibacter oboediens]|uniref:TetR family transcriptional regulator n=1 Tax=Komagataeibacter oboediens TaxID=65958 RepID=A0A318QYJ9_9PROT|nr:TetR/AcrR family transcriptional regulator [Komagataeibacter oboediens]MBL7232674.1 TetR/AcrR family transcriptional regulator [Komagataeibacter oboediens]MBT0676054.1 TetR/AcrR family transcriptional regulator [Komagataeibacter oboediens]MBT0679617.1 TetR/AcrR family transcriptional regulator [Komagataeibacter oboediens]MBV0888757.1 TetR/AcrR family transcriptional regulator [Komagataeibacter oboediens]MCK9821282.1 TetR/AcrR family transcriptional regulator [Komagataeibacter oboediens]